MNLLEHSKFAEKHRSKYTVWLKIKDRFTGIDVPAKILYDIAVWADANNIETEFGETIRFQGSMKEIADSYCFYTGIFAKNINEMNAIKIVWGEYLSNREL